MEQLGFLQPRPRCSSCGAAYTLEQLQVASRMERHVIAGVDVEVPVERYRWTCKRGHPRPSVLEDGCDLLSKRVSLRQQALVLWPWCQGQDGNPGDLAVAAHFHPEALTGRCGRKRGTSGFLDRVREAVASVQAARDAELQIGGPGIDVEADEVSFSARAVRVVAGEGRARYARGVAPMARGCRALGF